MQKNNYTIKSKVAFYTDFSRTAKGLSTPWGRKQCPPLRPPILVLVSGVCKCIMATWSDDGACREHGKRTIDDRDAAAADVADAG